VLGKRIEEGLGERFDEGLDTIERSTIEGAREGPEREQDTGMKGASEEEQAERLGERD
jgi:hypothetical protein